MSTNKLRDQMISIPADFPVSWTDPQDAKLLWRLDGHVTTAIAPLSFSVAEAVMRGFGQAFAQLGLPMRVRVADFNGYPYATVSPVVPPPATGTQVASANGGQLAQIEPILLRFDAYWQDELRPKNREQLAFFESAPLTGVDLPRLRTLFGEGLKQAESMGTLHALAAFPAVVAMSLFEEFYRELFPKATALDALRLLQSFENQTLRGDRALWQLSRAAAERAVVRRILDRYQPEAVMAALAGSDEGQAFLTQIAAYLAQYGRRLNGFAQLSEPSWIEDPLPAIACLQTYLQQPENNPAKVQARLAAERNQAVAQARQQLVGQPVAIREQFESLLSAAQLASQIKEDNHWILQELFYQMRRLALAVGQRLSAAGELPSAGDVFFLSGEELQAGVVLESAELNRRKTVMARFQQVTPPPMLGTMPSDSPRADGPFFRAIQKAEATNPRPAPARSQKLHGQAASTGFVRGRARVIGSLAEAGRLQPGEILVTRATTPPWTPLFEIASAVVTDVGGVLSHCAVVAREYGIPAVVGTGSATKKILDGQMLEVNGTAGTVQILSTPAAR